MTTIILFLMLVILADVSNALFRIVTELKNVNEHLHRGYKESFIKVEPK